MEPRKTNVSSLNGQITYYYSRQIHIETTCNSQCSHRGVNSYMECWISTVANSQIWISSGRPSLLDLSKTLSTQHPFSHSPFFGLIYTTLLWTDKKYKTYTDLISQSQFHTVLAGCRVGRKTYFTRLFAYNEGCLQHMCICYDSGAWRCPAGKERHIC